ncbi:hypothetical protein [Melittangium boletus]|uniref:Uncharacterized protein n=1 Tax=Melittangium boletus DSM 14713 TaxID=1294270 RepID=A0A250IEH1_9BACT|nr:hypothetical protein [Melittangium boletus]ATB29633.1 hypothetical protein MEBOL_003088 [Melittangium boletus DSM 14713]
MATLKARLVGKLKQVAVKAGNRGVHYLVEGTTAAAKAVDKLQATLAQKAEAEQPLETPLERSERTRPQAPGISVQAQATAERILEEARAVEQRIRGARPARNPLRISVSAEPEAPRPSTKSRSQGRKTTASATAPKRVTAPAGGFKAKRGQKHGH